MSDIQTGGSRSVAWSVRSTAIRFDRRIWAVRPVMWGHSEGLKADESADSFDAAASQTELSKFALVIPRTSLPPGKRSVSSYASTFTTDDTDCRAELTFGSSWTLHGMYTFQNYFPTEENRGRKNSKERSSKLRNKPPEQVVRSRRSVRVVRLPPLQSSPSCCPYLSGASSKALLPPSMTAVTIESR